MPASPAQSPPAQAAAPPPRDMKGTCVAVFDRERVCTDDFIPALVDARIRHDAPAGIAQAAQTQGRDTLVGKAKEEWSNDSKPDAIEATCTQITGTMPREQVPQMQKVAEDCLARPDCAGFVTCIIPMHEARLRK